VEKSEAMQRRHGGALNWGQVTGAAPIRIHGSKLPHPGHSQVRPISAAPTGIHGGKPRSGRGRPAG